MAFRFIRWFTRSKKNRRRFLYGCLGVVGFSVAMGELFVDHRHLPWRPLAIDDRAGFSTNLKLALLNRGPVSWCDKLLFDSQSLNVASVDPHAGAQGCGWANGKEISTSNGIEIRGGRTMKCPLAVASHIWLTTSNHLAKEMLGKEIAKVHHAGTYSCRRMYNRSRGPMSQHAFANAWDITGFELGDGRVISIARHWNTHGDEAEFLRETRDAACQVFNIVLSPDYNQAHHDHFHVDMGFGERCR